MRKVVLVGGLPRSGSRLIRRMLKAHGIDAVVRHRLKGWEEEMEPERVIVPTRAFQRQSLVANREMRAKTGRRGGARILSEQEAFEEHGRHKEHHAVMMEEFKGLPVMRVAYEELVEHPKEIGREIAAFCGVAEWCGWGERIFDGDKKHRAARARGQA